MFNSIRYLRYDVEHKYNLYKLYDDCFVQKIASPHNSPPLKNNVSNTITVVSIAKCYELKHRNLSLNLASYYNWLRDTGYYIDADFIKAQLTLIDTNINTKYCKNNYNAIMFYLKHKFNFKN